MLEPGLLSVYRRKPLDVRGPADQHDIVLLTERPVWI